MMIRLCLDLIDYIIEELSSENITKKEENSLKLIKNVLCDYVSTVMQKRKEVVHVTVRAESCVDYDSNDC